MAPIMGSSKEAADRRSIARGHAAVGGDEADGACGSVYGAVGIRVLSKPITILRVPLAFGGDAVACGGDHAVTDGGSAR